ncbi:MAG: hypothetical protein WDA05_03300 [Candidatus Methanomethylophilaceae archaeon]|jgi:hypothetical protein|nr:hypothetical protein [Candidatus Methanomethylophilaceae archaeon]MDI9378225.1 hypothetical protein [Candidatus Thermoplasmatota archaeon]MDD2779572.1 hypothetical protein [Candidatus Methanomethylophilaceae archaeon]MDD3127909.1 hypothetical protein [Candidatus Methanomethylophilaceae archaeon]MDD4119560.1 hypothetical protein [Candidatus Methanomethylophilaceae archaeon]
MRFTVTRLCGGKALMAASRDLLDVDLERAGAFISEEGSVKKSDDLMMVADWRGMEITIYPQGKVMFHPLSDRDTAVKYATEILLGSGISGD